jgi:hypothetical protein
MSLEMPLDYYGEVKTGSKYVKSKPRTWTEQEIAWVQEANKAGNSAKVIAKAIGRTDVSVMVKLKRLGKKQDTYNDANRTMKYEANERFLKLLKPKTLLDLYAANSYYKQHSEIELTDNDTDFRFNTAHHEDALKLLCKMYSDNTKFDVIDLDPYGSAYDCFDLAIKMARKGIAISFGEWGHKRWRRYDFVRPRYGITNNDDFISDAFIAELQRIARLSHKQLEVVESLQYANFCRIYFKISKLKITEQWDDNPNLPQRKET